MKKLIKRTGITLVAGFALLGAGGTALAANGYITRGGSDAYNSTLVTSQEIGAQGQKLKGERDAEARENEQLLNVIKDKENLIDAKQKEIDALKKNDKSTELQQAEKDMKDLEQKAKDALNGLK